MIRLPKTVPMGEETYQVRPVYKDEFTTEGVSVVAECNGIKRTIRIAVGTRAHPRPEADVWASLLHEISHAAGFYGEECRADAVACAVQFLAEFRDKAAKRRKGNS